MFRRSAIAVALVGAALGASAPQAVALGAGDLDPTFSGDGYALLGAPGWPEADATAVAAAPDGKVVVGLDMRYGAARSSALVRLLPDGALDPTFGSGGVRMLATDCGRGNEQVAALAVYPDGRVLTGGSCKDQFLLRRFGLDGSDDQSFDGDPGNPGGGNGIVRTAFTSAAGISHIALGPGGAITAAGICCTGVGPSYQDSVFARYRDDGTLDPGFDGDPGNPAGGNGRVQIGLDPNFDDRGEAMVETADGGFAFTGRAKEDAFVAVIGADGKLRKSFSGDGVMSVPGPGPFDTGRMIDEDAGGNLLIGIEESGGPTPSFRVVRVTAAGALDPGFGPLVVEPAPGQKAEPGDLAIGANGSIVLSGGVYTESAPCPCGYPVGVFVARLLADGQPDPGFGPGGVRTFPGPAGGAHQNGLAFDSEGSILLAGTSFSFPNFDPGADTGLVTRILSAEPKPVAPSNRFKFGKLKRNKKKGTAVLIVQVPGPGVVKLAKSKKVKGAVRQAKKAGKVGIPIKLKGKAKRKLARLARKAPKVGRLKLKVKVTYTPTGGSPLTLPKKLTLLKRAP